jgi:hypothetical protein
VSRSDVKVKVKFIPPVFSAKYENERKTIRRAVYEEYQAFKSELSKIQKSRKEFLHSEKIDKLMQTFKEHYIETSALLEQLKIKDTLDVIRKQAIRVQYLSHVISNQSTEDPCNFSAWGKVVLAKFLAVYFINAI